MKKLNLIIGAAEIRKSNKSIANRTTRIRSDIHKTAVSCLNHTMLHGDWTLSAELIQSLGKGIQSSKLVKWFEELMDADYDQASGKFAYNDGISHKDITPEVIDAVSDYYWYDFKSTPKDNTKELKEIKEAVDKMLSKSLETKKVSSDEIKAIDEIFNTLIKSRPVLAAVAA